MPKIGLKLGESPEETELKITDSARKFYPSFRIESDEKPELPHSGTMTIRFKKVASEQREDSDGDEHYSCQIEVHEIVDAYSDEPEAPARNRNKGTEDALEAGRSEQMAKRKKSVDY